MHVKWPVTAQIEETRLSHVLQLGSGIQDSISRIRFSTHSLF